MQFKKKVFVPVLATTTLLALAACSSDDDSTQESNIKITKDANLVLDDSAPDTDYTITPNTLKSGAAQAGMSIQEFIDTKIKKPMEDLKIDPQSCQDPYTRVRLALQVDKEDSSQASGAVTPNTTPVEIRLRPGNLTEKMQNDIDAINQNCSNATSTEQAEDENGNVQTATAKINSKVKKFTTYKGQDVYQIRTILKAADANGEDQIAADDQTFFTFYRGVTAITAGPQAPADALYLLQMQIDKLKSYDDGAQKNNKDDDNSSSSSSSSTLEKPSESSSNGSSSPASSSSTTSTPASSN